VTFRQPYDQVVAMWQECMRAAYDPEALYARYEYQSTVTYPKRIKLEDSVMNEPSWQNLRRGAIFLSRIIWHVGIRGSYRRVFWRFAWRRLRAGQFEDLIASALVAHHLIMFSREATSGRRNASNYNFRAQPTLVPAE
jgi:hypothetical protein